MEIVAIIPARINTKRIPNKMLRIVGKHPLVYYAIKNAQLSKYITQIIVSTDSDKIAMIAKHMGVEYVIRDSKICQDDTPLDIVIYEAVKDIECDYVVTLQPTSPLLKVQTLDQAIELCIKDNDDSLISVINKPRLAWGKTDNNYLPQYQKRLNSQFLPPCYMETGAFFISKREVVTPDSRLGKKNDLFEVSADEAVAVCDMQDLALANMMINQKKVAFYVNGNRERGMGHIYRVLELADEFYIKPDVYFDKKQTLKTSFGNTNYDLIGIETEEEMISKLIENKYDILINDILSTNDIFMDKLKKGVPNIKIINFEDEGSGALKADLIINALYRDDLGPKFCCGEQYYIVPKDFLFYDPISINKTVKNVFICFGGADPGSYTLKVLNLINNDGLFSEYNFVVVVGRANADYNVISSLNLLKNINVLFDVDNISELMSNCDVAITSRGRTAFELAVLGVPTISLAQNIQEERHEFVSEENGFIYLGCQPSDSLLKQTLTELLLSNEEERRKMQNRMLKNDLRGGRDRVMHLIQSI